MNHRYTTVWVWGVVFAFLAQGCNENSPRSIARQDDAVSKIMSNLESSSPIKRESIEAVRFLSDDKASQFIAEGGLGLLIGELSNASSTNAQLASESLEVIISSQSNRSIRDSIAKDPKFASSMKKLTAKAMRKYQYETNHYSLLLKDLIAILPKENTLNWLEIPLEVLRSSEKSKKLDISNLKGATQVLIDKRYLRGEVPRLVDLQDKSFSDLPSKLTPQSHGLALNRLVYLVPLLAAAQGNEELANKGLWKAIEQIQVLEKEADKNSDKQLQLMKSICWKKLQRVSGDSPLAKQIGKTLGRVQGDFSFCESSIVALEEMGQLGIVLKVAFKSLRKIENRADVYTDSLNLMVLLPKWREKVSIPIGSSSTQPYSGSRYKSLQPQSFSYWTNRTTLPTKVTGDQLKTASAICRLTCKQEPRIWKESLVNFESKGNGVGGSTDRSTATPNLFESRLLRKTGSSNLEYKPWRAAKSDISLKKLKDKLNSNVGYLEHLSSRGKVQLAWCCAERVIAKYKPVVVRLREHLQALFQTDNQMVAGFCIDVLLVPDDQVQQLALRWLGEKLGAKRATEAFFMKFRSRQQYNTSQTKLYKSAITELNKSIGDEYVRSAFKSAAEAYKGYHEIPWVIKMVAIDVLSNLGSKKSIEDLSHLLDDPDGYIDIITVNNVTTRKERKFSELAKAAIQKIKKRLAKTEPLNSKK